MMMGNAVDYRKNPQLRVGGKASAADHLGDHGQAVCPPAPGNSRAKAQLEEPWAQRLVARVTLVS